MRGKNLLLTGLPGVGKTTVIQRTLALLPSQLKVGGFFTVEVREGGQRVGFQIVTVDGRKAWLARKGFVSPRKVGKYGVDLEAIERVVIPTLNQAVTQADLIVIDEIAKMELSHPAFAEVVWKCLESSKPVLGTIQQSQLPFIERVKAREDTVIWEVTQQNRNELPERIVKALAQLLSKPLCGL